MTATMAGGVVAVTFLCAASPAVAEDVQWDANWNIADAPQTIPDQNVISDIPSEFSFLSATGSAYTADGQTIVRLAGTAADATDVSVVAGAGMTTQDTSASEGPITVDTWMKVTGGTYATLVGGSYAQNYGGGAPADFTGDTHILLTSEGGTAPTVDYIIGGNYMDSQNATFTGDSYISVEGGSVNGSIIGAGTAAHNQTSLFKGNSNVWVYTPQSSSAANRFNLPGNLIVGGSAGIANSNPKLNLAGNSNVTVDLSAYDSTSGGATSMEKVILGDAWLQSGTVSTHTGNAAVTIKGADSTSANISFSQPVVAGAWFAGGGSASLSGDSSLSVTGGSFSNALVGGNYLASDSATGVSSTIGGSTSLTLGGALEMNGSDAMVIGGSYVNAASATLNSGAHSITLSDGTYAGNIIGGSYITAGSGTVTQETGDITLTVSGGTLSGAIYGGSYTARDNAESVNKHGAVSISLEGGTINGNVYAGGGVASAAQGSVTAQSTQVSIGNGVTLGSVTISGGIEGANEASSIAGDRTLMLGSSSEYTNLDSATFADFNIINAAAAASINFSTADSSFSKQGVGTLTLSGGADALRNVAELSVTGGALDAGAATLTNGGQGLTSLTVSDGGSLSAAALTMAEGSALSLGISAAAPTQTLVNITGELSLMGQTPLALTLTGAANLAADSSATLLSWGSAATPLTLENINWTKGEGLEAYELQIDGNSLVLHHVAEMEWDASGTWSAGADTDGKAAIFNTPTAGNAVVSISGDVAPQSIVVNNEGDTSYTFEADATTGGSITGDTSLTKNGSGELVMNLANTYSGGTIVNDGTLNAAVAGTPTSGALGTGAVQLNGGILLASAENALAANAVELAGGSLSYTANETRELGAAGITHAAGTIPAISVGPDATVTWQYADAAPLQAALADGVELSGGGTLTAEGMTPGENIALAGPITLTGEGTTLEFAGSGTAQLGTANAPMAISLGEGTTLRVQLPQTEGSSSTVDSTLSGNGTLEIASGSATAPGTVQLSGDASGFTGSINLGSVAATMAQAADAPTVLLDYSKGSPVGAEGSTLNLNGLSFAIVQPTGNSTTTLANINLNANTTQYAQTAGLNNTFSGTLTGASGLSWMLDATPVDGGQTNTLTGELSGFEGTLEATGKEGSLARWVLSSAAPVDAQLRAVSPETTLALNLAAANQYNEFVLDYAQDITLGGVISGQANLTQQGAGTLVLTGDNTTAGTLTIAEGSTVQLGHAGDAGQWGVAAGSALAGNGTLSLVNGTLAGPLNVAAGASPVINVDAAAGQSINMGGNEGSLINGGLTMAAGSTLTGVRGNIVDQELNMTLAAANIGKGEAATAMVQFMDGGSNSTLGSTTAAINVDASMNEVVTLLSQHRVAGVESYLTLTNGSLITAADYSNVNLGQNMDVLGRLGLRLEGVDGGSLVVSGVAEGVYIAGPGQDPTSVTGYPTLGAYQSVAVMGGQTLTLTLDGAPDPLLDGPGATINNLLGGEDSALVVNNTNTTGDVAVVYLNNTLQTIDPTPGGLPGDPAGASTTFAGSIAEAEASGDVEFIKTGAGTLRISGTVDVHQLSAQRGSIVLNGADNKLDVLSLQGGTTALNNGLTTVETLEDTTGGRIRLAGRATLDATGSANTLEATRIDGPGTLRVSGGLTLADTARLDGVALELARGTVTLDGSNAHSVSALNGDGTLSGNGTAATTGLSITGDTGRFEGALAGNGTLTIAAGAQQRFANGFSGGAGWTLTNNGSMSLDFQREDNTNSPLSLGALNLGAGSVTGLILNTDSPVENLLTLGSISAGQGAAVNLSGGRAENILREDTRYVLGTVTGGQPAGVLTSLSPDAGNVIFMLLDAERSNLEVDAAGNLLLNLVTSRENKLAALTSNSNSRAGAEMLWNAAIYGDTAVGTDIRRLLERLNDTAAAGDADRILAAASGASNAVLGAAFASDLQRQLRAIRNRTTMMQGKTPCGCKGALRDNSPRFSAWINGEGDHRKMKADGFMPGYSLSSWGGTVGMDMSCSENLVGGLALTAMYGDLDAHSADNASGDFDRYYITAFAKMKQKRWQHTLLATVGRLDADLNRTVDFGTGSYHAHGDTKGWGYGAMYEIGYNLPMDEDSNFTLQPVANVTWRYADLDGYTENGSDAALRVGDQDYNVVTFGAGIRAQAEVGQCWFNRKALLEGRALVKVDTGDREGKARVAMLGGGGRWESVRSAKLDAVGVELGAGLSIPLGDDNGAIFIDGSAELRNEYSNLNGTLGYRFEF